MPGNIADITLSAIELWPAPNYAHPTDRQTWLVPYACALQVICTVMVTLRVWLRITQQAGSLGLDDILLIPSYLGATALTVSAILSNKRYGVDRHVWDVPFDWFSDAVMLAFISQVTFVLSTSFTKVSVLLFYRRFVAGKISNIWRLATIGAIFTTVLYATAIVAILLSTCQPIAAYWKFYDPYYDDSYVCHDTKFVNLLSGLISVVSDVYAVLLPMALLRQFEMSRRQRIALYTIFSLGLLVAAIGCVRTYYIHKLGIDEDITWVGYYCFVWSLLECDLALIFACAPSLRVFFRRYLSEPLYKARQISRSGALSRNTDRETPEVDRVVVTMKAYDARSHSEVEENKLLPVHEKVSLSTHASQDTSSDDRSIMPSPPLAALRRGLAPAVNYETFALEDLERSFPPPPPPPRPPRSVSPPPAHVVNRDRAVRNFNQRFTDR